MSNGSCTVGKILRGSHTFKISQITFCLLGYFKYLLWEMLECVLGIIADRAAYV